MPTTGIDGISSSVVAERSTMRCGFAGTSTSP